MIKKIVKKIIGKNALSFYHLFLARLAAWYYKKPSDQLIVIGVTGTNGKTATVNFISQFLDILGQSNGLASTVNFKVADKEWLNDKKMTMLGRFQTQKLLADMVKVGCKYAVIETSSQGVEQSRHIGINYDLVVFTNLTPEHIEAHGSFENYRACKEKLFQHLAESRRKKINGQSIDKIIVSNNDDKETARLKLIKADKFVTYAIDREADYKATNIKLKNGVSFSVKGQDIKTDFIARFNVYNILASLATIAELGLSLDKINMYKISNTAGRQEWISSGESQNFKGWKII